ncbi:MAG: tetratricopeptide repeat protein [Cyanobacteria bacterium J06632_22]
MLELTFTLVVFAGWVVSVCLHEFGHAVVAYWGGDTSVKDKGYLTLNPLKYTNPGLSFVMPLMFLLLGGIPLPGAAVYINARKLRSRMWKSAVSAAGPLASFLCAVAIAILLAAIQPDLSPDLSDGTFNLDGFASPKIWWAQALAFLLTLEIAAVLLNLMPIPGLDGYGILEPWLPPGARVRFNKLRRYGFIALFAAFWLIPSFNRAFWGLVDGISQVLGVSPLVASTGFRIFRQSSEVIIVVLIVGLIVARLIRGKAPVQPSDEPSQADLTTLLKETEESLAVLPEDWDAWQQKGAILIELERYDEALAALDQAVVANPKAVKALNSKAWLLLAKLNRPPDALQALEKSLETRQNQPDIWHFRGVILAEMKRIDEALAAFDTAIRHSPRHEAAWFSKSAALFTQGQYAEAVAATDWVLKANPKRADACYNKACCFSQLGDTVQALLWLEKCFVLDDGTLRQQALTDEDLQAVRSHPRFQTLVALPS